MKFDIAQFADWSVLGYGVYGDRSKGTRYCELAKTSGKSCTNVQFVQAWVLWGSQLRGRRTE
jgi:hypothetical protein